MKSLEDRKKKILEELCNNIYDVQDDTKSINQALTKLNALDKSKIDEGKLAKIIKPRYFLLLFVPFIGVYGTAKRIAHAIAQKAEEWIG